MAEAVANVEADLGATVTATVSTKLFKSLLTMDPYVLVAGGTTSIRNIQQWMNARYINRRDFEYIPTDGRVSRSVQTALIYALQYEIGMSDSVANGRFGPGTQQGVRDQARLTMGSTGPFVWLYQAALTFNGYPVVFDGYFGNQGRTTTLAFQAFAALPETGIADFQTWASLLVSTGDPTRQGTACDGVTEVTAPRAEALWNQGYRYVGRYLTNAAGSSLNKRIQPGELTTLFTQGFRVYPIYQTYGGSATYFNEAQGRSDAIDAFNAATVYGFRRQTVVYFAVDFDATDIDVDANILPHFRAIAAMMQNLGSKYQIGVYGSRNVCTRVSDAGYAVYSFVSGISTGYSGNLGYPLPRNWAFDQISTITVGSGSSAIEIDNNIASLREIGQMAVDSPTGILDVPMPLTSIQDYAAFMQDYFWWFEQATTPLQQAVILYPPQDVFEDIIGNHDDLLTSLARGYNMRKSLIETAVLWESSVRNVLDVGADLVTEATYEYFEAREAWEALPPDDQLIVPPPTPPAVQRTDSSTGPGQIKPSTAATAIAWGRARAMTDEPLYDASDWHDERDLWRRLRDDEGFNIRMCALVLLWGANNIGLNAGNALNFTVAEIKLVLARYNGTSSDATEYGERNYGLYRLLEERINAPARQ